MDDDTLHPLTLNEYLGALTVVWVVPLMRTELTPVRRLPASTAHTPSELDKEPTPFGAKILNPYLYNVCCLSGGLTTANFDRNQLLPDSIGFLPLIPS